MSTPQDLLEFWFGAAADEARVLERGVPRWFGRDDAFDREIERRFATALQAASHGELSAWATRPEGRLALLILLDQMPRNIHRGNAAAFATDGLAQSLALEGLRLGHDRRLERPQRAFFYLPLEHAETLSLQHCSVALFADLHAEAPTAVRSHYAVFLDYAERHREVIAQFGRFPHRNAALGRQSSAAERDYLAQPDAGF